MEIIKVEPSSPVQVDKLVSPPLVKEEGVNEELADDVDKHDEDDARSIRHGGEPEKNVATTILLLYSTKKNFTLF